MNKDFDDKMARIRSSAAGKAADILEHGGKKIEDLIKQLAKVDKLIAEKREAFHKVIYQSSYDDDENSAN